MPGHLAFFILHSGQIHTNRSDNRCFCNEPETIKTAAVNFAPVVGRCTGSGSHSRPPPSSVGEQLTGKVLRLGHHPFHRQLNMVGILFNPNAAAVQPGTRDRRRATSQKRVEHQVAFVGRGQQAALYQRHRFLRGMSAQGFFRPSRCGKSPDRFHLFASDRLHGGIIKTVFALLVLGRPQHGLGAMGEVAAAQVRWRVGFFPRDVVENLEAQLLHGVTDGENNMVCAGHPERSIRFEHTLAAAQPFQIKLVIQIRAAGFIPSALVHLDPLSAPAGSATVGEKIRWIGKNSIEAPLGIFRLNSVEDLEGIPLKNPDAAGGVVTGLNLGAFSSS